MARISQSRPWLSGKIPTCLPSATSLLVGREARVRFRGGLAFKAHRPLYHSTLGLRVIKKKKKYSAAKAGGGRAVDSPSSLSETGAPFSSSSYSQA